MPDRIALIRQGDRPRLNGMLADLLRATFPGHPVDDVDVLAEVRRRHARYAWAAATGVVEHAVPLARRATTPKRAVVRSSGFAAAAQAVVREVVSPASHWFTLQSQSLFPAAVPGVPHVVYTDHCHLANLGYPGFDLRQLASARFLRMEAELYRSAAMVLARSRHVRDAITHGYGCPEERVAVIGVGPNVDPATLPERTGWHGGRIVFVGVDWERKGGPDLLAAFRRVRADHPTARLEVVGCEPPGVAGFDGVTVHGRRSLADVATILTGSDVFCLPTRAEPFGVAFVEAMHAGLPIVGTAIGAVPDLVVPGETGTTVPVGDVDALHRALTELLADPERTQRLGCRARELARQRYDWGPVMVAMRSHVLERIPDRGPDHAPGQARRDVRGGDTS